MQGGLTDLWLDDPYVVAARKLVSMAEEENAKGKVFPVSTPSSPRGPLPHFNLACPAACTIQEDVML
jgi:hypothetical protein